MNCCQNLKKKISNEQIIIPNGQRLGSKVIEIKNLNKAYNSNLLISDLSFSLPAGGIIGVVGPNGSGKQHFSECSLTKRNPIVVQYQLEKL